MALNGRRCCRSACPLSGVKRTSLVRSLMSANDPKRTSSFSHHWLVNEETSANGPNVFSGDFPEHYLMSDFRRGLGEQCKCVKLPLRQNALKRVGGNDEPQ